MPSYLVININSTCDCAASFANKVAHEGDKDGSCSISFFADQERTRKKAV